MPISSPTPEAFLAQPADPEDDLEEESPAEPLESIAESLRRIVDLLALRSSAPDSEDQERVDYITELEDRCVAKQALIDEVLAICKPSTSKLANNIRTVLDPPEPEVVEPEPVDEPVEVPAMGGFVGQPTFDASVEAWRAYARSQGYTGPDVDTMNRSQIRTMLGLPHPAEAADGSEGTA